MGNKITFEPRYSFHQRTVLIGFSVVAMIGLINSIPQNIEILEFLPLIFYLSLILFLLTLTFSKKGLLKKGKRLFRMSSIFNIILFKSRIDLIERPIVSVLQFKKTQKFAFVSSANPDQGESFNSFEIFVLNQRHTKRDSVIYFKKKENADKAIDFLTTNFPLKHEIFSPDFS